MSSQGVCEERELSGVQRLGVELLILFAPPLFAHVVGDGVGVAVLSHSGHEGAVQPELAAPQLLLDVRAPLEHLTPHDALERLHDLQGAVGGHAL